MPSPSKLGFAHFARKLFTAPKTSTVAAVTGLSKKTTYGGLITEVFPLVNVNVSTTEAGAAGAYGGLKIADLPEGNITILSASTNLTIAKVGSGISASAAVVGSLGTVTAGADATLTSTEANIVPSTAATLGSGTGAFRGELTTMLVADGTTTRVPVYLNFAMPDAGSTANDALTVNGSITLVYVVGGDN